MPNTEMGFADIAHHTALESLVLSFMKDYKVARGWNPRRMYLPSWFSRSSRIPGTAALVHPHGVICLRWTNRVIAAKIREWDLQV